MSYNLSNAAWVSDQTGYSIESIVALAEVAKCLGIQFKIEGMPFGAEYGPAKAGGKYDGTTGTAGIPDKIYWSENSWPVGKGG